jgi:hypothetical protein
MIVIGRSWFIRKNGLLRSLPHTSNMLKGEKNSPENFRGVDHGKPCVNAERTSLVGLQGSSGVFLSVIDAVTVQVDSPWVSPHEQERKGNHLDADDHVGNADVEIGKGKGVSLFESALISENPKDDLVDVSRILGE